MKNLKRFSRYRADTKLYQKQSKGNNSKNTQARVMVLVHDTSSRRGLQGYQVSLKNYFQVLERTRFVTDRQTDRQTDGRTDGQTDARGKTICLPTLKGGDIKTMLTRRCSIFFLANMKIHEHEVYGLSEGSE